MYTIKQASLRTGVSVPLLRAWERRYGIPSPTRTASGYRLYDEAALARVRRMKTLVGEGWAPSQAAQEVLGWEPEMAEAAEAAAAAGTAAGNGGHGNGQAATGALGAAASTGPLAVDRFVASAVALDEAGLDDALADAFATLPPDDAIERFAMPALRAVGDAWSDGTLDVAGEHAASSVVMRRLGAMYEAAGQPAADPDAIVGLPPRGRHEAGALAFAVLCRRAGLRVLYLGADVPIGSWLAATRAHPRAALILAAVTADEAASASDVVRALRAERPPRLVAVGGASAASVGDGTMALGPDLRAAASQLRSRLRS